jgi:hypothetical protein
LNGPPPLFIAAFIGIFALVIVGAIYGLIAAKRRREEMRAWASARGMAFDPSRRGIESSYPNFKCLRQGSGRYAHNMMNGQWQGRRFLGFDYHYETHSTDSKGHTQTNHHHFSAVILGSDVPLEPLFIRPEGFFDKITEFFGIDDIDFESAEFSRKFYVKASDRRWAFDVIHARTMEFLLAQPRFSIEFDRNSVIAWRSSRFSLAEFEQAAEVVRGILDLLPDYVVKQRREMSAPA